MSFPHTTAFVVTGLLLVAVPDFVTVWAQTSDELEIEGKIDTLELGAEAAHKKNVDGMIEELTPEIESGRLSATELERALSMRCWAHFEKGMLDLALADCNRVLTDHPDHGVALLLRASTRIRQKQFAAAIGDLRSCHRGGRSRRPATCVGLPPPRHRPPGDGRRQERG